MLKILATFLYLIISSTFLIQGGKAQFFVMPADQSQIKIPFELIRNVIVLDVKINNQGPYKFVLDSGAGIVLITEPTLLDTLKFKSKTVIQIRGITEDTPFPAIIPEPQSFNIAGIQSVNVSPAILKEDFFGVSNFAGFKIHGIIGYNFFSSFPVEINFDKKELTVFAAHALPNKFRKNKIPLEIAFKKPYIKGDISFYDGSTCHCLLIVDTGAGHALSLEKNTIKTWPTKRRIPANLGSGITGLIEGEVGRIDKLKIGKNRIRKVVTAFPKNVLSLESNNNRDGNIGIQLLKRFNILLNYPEGYIVLVKRENYLAPFEHELSGLEFFATGKNFESLVINRVEPDSPADLIGLKSHDELIKINLQPVSKLSLDQLDLLLNEEEGKTLLLEVDRNGQRLFMVLVLKRRI